MEGLLLKWTNYFSGWKPRYFVLEGLFLTYYLSKEDVGRVFKGSMKMAVCEINVHPTDIRRFELNSPGEPSLCLKAQSCGDRQRWLVALGSAKACLTVKRPKEETGLAGCDGSLRVKMSELQLCCHLLVEQVHKLQGCGRHLEDQAQVCAQSLLAASSFLRKTCSKFLTTLEDCMKIYSCHNVPQPCTLAPPISHSAVDQSSQQRILQLTCSARQTDGAVADRPVLLGLEAQPGQTVKRSIEQMAAVHLQRRRISRIHHQGATLTVSNSSASDSRAESRWK
ncbi:hypothetical protein SKAU_G00424770 [Synaphobranchus kaupii]|uniref:Sesquipedalian n=1 Tax=Synaphobranchus kaupii TaxID=118154 RepID=A0A9Q1E5K8_SYNKA|nr:hypothetical protein SKAU_G00424770 [Synaphobranchus kaupii]